MNIQEMPFYWTHQDNPIARLVKSLENKHDGLSAKVTLIDEMYGVPVAILPTNVIFNGPATIVFWNDGTKTVVKCSDGDTFDPEKGLAMAFSKKLFGNKGNYCKQFKKWLPKEEKATDEKHEINLTIPDMTSAIESIRKLNENLKKFRKDRGLDV